MNTMIEEIRKRIKAASDDTEAGHYDEYESGQGVGLATALQIIDEVVKEHPVPSDVQEASRNYADKRLLENKRELAESGHTRHFKMGYVCFAGYEIEEAFADGMLAERERLMKEAVEGTLGYEPHLLRPIVILEQVPKIWDGSSSNPVSVIIIKKEK